MSLAWLITTAQLAACLVYIPDIVDRLNDLNVALYTFHVQVELMNVQLPVVSLYLRRVNSSKGLDFVQQSLNNKTALAVWTFGPYQ